MHALRIEQLRTAIPAASTLMQDRDMALHLTGDAATDDPLALLIGMLLDQQSHRPTAAARDSAVAAHRSDSPLGDDSAIYLRGI